MQVTRKPPRSLGTPSWAPASGRPPALRRRRRRGGSPRRRRGMAFGTTVVFGDNQVGTQYPNGIQVSDDQIIKPIGDRLLTQIGKFMGSTVSPDGRFLAATSADKSVVLQIFDLSSYKLIWTVGTASGVNQTPVRRHCRTGRPDVLAGRQVPLASRARRADPVPGQPRRHPRRADPFPDPDGGRPPFGNNRSPVPTPRWWARPRTRPTGRPCTPRSTGRTPSWRSTPTPVRSSRRGTSASPPWARLRRRQALRERRGRPPGPARRHDHGLLRHPGARQRVPGHVDNRSRQRHRHPRTRPRRSDRSPSACIRPRCTPTATRCSSPTRTVTPSPLSTRRRTRFEQTIETKPWPESSVGYEPDGIAMTKGGHLLVTLGRL